LEKPKSSQVIFLHKKNKKHKTAQSTENKAMPDVLMCWCPP
jgi:hypothetical protein